MWESNGKNRNINHHPLFASRVIRIVEIGFGFIKWVWWSTHTNKKLSQIRGTSRYNISRFCLFENNDNLGRLPSVFAGKGSRYYFRSVPMIRCSVEDTEFGTAACVAYMYYMNGLNRIKFEIKCWDSGTKIIFGFAVIFCPAFLGKQGWLVYLLRYA